jgi:hypothetical protein
MLLSRLLIVSAVSVLFNGFVFAQRVSIQVRLSSEEIEEVTFEPGLATEVQIRRWILLSQDGPYHEADLSSCIELKDYPKSKRFEQERAAAQKLTAELDEAKFPPELSGIVRYLKRVRSLWFWIDTKQISFLQTGDLSSLEEKYTNVDPRQACALPIRKIRGCQNRMDAINMVCLDWHNCMLAAEMREIGMYPVDDWKHFLSAYGIREHIISTEEH